MKPLAPSPAEPRPALGVASPPARLVVITTTELRAIVADELAKHREDTAPKLATAHSEWLTAEDAAAFMQLHTRTLARMAEKGELAVSKIGRHARYRRSDLEAFLERRTQTGKR